MGEAHFTKASRSAAGSPPKALHSVSADVMPLEKSFSSVSKTLLPSATVRTQAPGWGRRPRSAGSGSETLRWRSRPRHGLGAG